MLPTSESYLEEKEGRMLGIWFRLGGKGLMFEPFPAFLLVSVALGFGEVLSPVSSGPTPLPAIHM